ncbi:hypothetical protein SEA_PAULODIABOLI_270 [Microbacterium phage PauloDiaboli]|nr:hypothetical protein SEA_PAULODIABOLI_270 [Microbacterium phage PauloDiaboli]
MNETVTIVDPGWDWAFTLAWSLPFLGILALGILASIAQHKIRGWRRKDFFENLAFIFYLTGGIGAFICIVFVGGLWNMERYSQQYDDRIVAELKEAGFTSIDLTSKKNEPIEFTASLEGEYVKAILVEDGPNNFQVVELVNK